MTPLQQNLIVAMYSFIFIVAGLIGSGAVLPKRFERTFDFAACVAGTFAVLCAMAVYVLGYL